MSAAEIFFHRNLRNLNRKKKMQDGLGVKIKPFFVDFLSFRKEDKKKKKNSLNGSYCVRPV